MTDISLKLQWKSFMFDKLCDNKNDETHYLEIVESVYLFIFLGGGGRN